MSAENNIFSARYLNFDFLITYWQIIKFILYGWHYGAFIECYNHLMIQIAIIHAYGLWGHKLLGRGLCDTSYLATSICTVNCLVFYMLWVGIALKIFCLTVIGKWSLSGSSHLVWFLRQFQPTAIITDFNYNEYFNTWTSFNLRCW